MAKIARITVSDEILELSDDDEPMLMQQQPGTSKSSTTSQKATDVGNVKLSTSMALPFFEDILGEDSDDEEVHAKNAASSNDQQP